MADILKAAGAYQDKLKWAVLACAGKAPAQPEKAGGHGYLSATKDFDEFARIWRAYGADSVGISCVGSLFLPVREEGRPDIFRDFTHAVNGIRDFTHALS